MLAIRAAKQAVLKAANAPLDEGLDFERKSFYLLLSSEDRKEAMRAFLENASRNLKDGKGRRRLVTKPSSTKSTDGLATLTLNRPQSLNAFVPQMNQEVVHALKDGERDQEVRCLMITGAGRAFCAGQDLKGRTPEQKVSLGASLREKYNPMIRQIRQMEKIVIAAVNGVAAGAGCNFALACDLRVASEEAKFIQSFVRVGLAPDSGGSFILPRLIGLSKAMELLLLGDSLDAHEALRIGLVARVFPGADFARSAKEIGERVAKAPDVASV